MKKQIRIVMVEDDLADAELIRHALKKDGLAFHSERVETRDDYVQALEKDVPDLILSDYSLPAFDGYTALALAQQMRPDVPFIFVTGTMGEEVAIETLKNGATDYVLKVRLTRLGPAVHRALREARERADRKRAVDQLQQSHEQLRALSDHLQHVREEERMRISRAVHDELGQALTGLKLDLSWLGGRLPRRFHSLTEKMKSMSSHIDKTIQTVRRISTELRPGILDHLGLGAAIEWQANEFQTRTGIHCKVGNSLQQPVVDDELNTVFFRIFQETLTNIIRHADATRVEIHLHEREGQLILEVKDNGRGISQVQISNVESLGLLGMRERAALLGGSVQISGAPRKGTTVTISIPFAHPKPLSQLHHENTYSRRSCRSTARAETNPRRRL